MKISSITSALAGFFRTVGSTAQPGAGEGLLSTHLEDLNGRPLALLQGQPLNTAQYGLPLVLQNDGNAVMARGDRFGGIATAATQPLFSWFVEGATLNSRLFFTFAATMTAVQSAQGLALNAAANATASNFFQINPFKQVELHMKAPVLMRKRMRVTNWGLANASVEFGYTNIATTLGTTPNTNGAYWRFDPSGVMPVFAFNGVIVSTGTDVGALLDKNAFYHYGITKDDDAWVFTIQNSTTGVVLTRQTLQVPNGQQKAFLASHAQPYLRVFYGGVAPVSAVQVLSSEWTIGLLDTNLNLTASQIATGIGLGSETNPFTYAVTSNLGNATVAPTTVPTNTTATVSALDGAMRFAAPAGSANDLALFSFTVPNPYRYRCKRVLVALKNLGAIVAVTPTQVDLFVCANGNGVTLVGNLARKYVGTQTFPVGAAIGAGALEGPIAVDLSAADLVTEAGRVISLVARISTGTATTLQVLEVMYTNLGHFE